MTTTFLPAPQIGHRGDDIGQATAGQRDLAPLIDAGRDQHRVVAGTQVVESRIASDFEFGVEADAAVGEAVGAPDDDRLIQFEVGDTIDQQPAKAIVAVVDVHAVALATQFLGRGQPARSGADDTYRGRPFTQWPQRSDPALLPRGFGDEFFDRADGDRAVGRLLDDAIALAETVLGANAAADFGHVVGRRGDLVGLFQATTRRQHQPVGDVVLQRTMDLAERDTALRTPCRLLGRPFDSEFVIDFPKVVAPAASVALRWRRLVDGDEFQHGRGHPYAPGEGVAISGKRVGPARSPHNMSGARTGVEQKDVKKVSFAD
jgi:hypothetical protein